LNDWNSEHDRQSGGEPGAVLQGAGRGRYCLVIGGEPLLYHQIALRLALEGYGVTGVGPAGVNARLQREIKDAGGIFCDSTISEISGGDTVLTVLESRWPFQTLEWSAQRRIYISSEGRPVTVPGKSAFITFPQELTQAVLSDMAEQVTALLTYPPHPYHMRYSTLPNGRSYRRTIRPPVPADGAPAGGEQSDDFPLEGTEVRSTEHGHGVFATWAHRRGERVMVTSGVRLNHQTEHTIQISLRQHLEPRFPVRLINHSCNPNLGVKTTLQGLPDFYALRDLRAGEELTFDYAMTELMHVPRADQALEFSLECHCGEPSCRGQLGYYSTLPASHKRRYAGSLSAYLLALDAGEPQPSSPRSGGVTEPTP
jgi:hypothetical protein